MIKEKYMDVVGGLGGPNGNAIPVYSDNKAPNGGQVIGPNGKQLMLENSEVSGVHYVIVDPALITKEENLNSRYITYNATGQVNYIRLWILDAKTGHGVDYAFGIQMWVEYSHLSPYSTEPPQKLHKLVLEEISPGLWTVTELP